MIRTGIYDGHTPGPWKLDDRIWEMYLGLEPDVMLMQDAPLLLEAYKRLVIVADELYLHIVGEPHMTLDELVAEMPWREEE